VVLAHFTNPLVAVVVVVIVVVVVVAAVGGFEEEIMSSCLLVRTCQRTNGKQLVAGSIDATDNNVAGLFVRGATTASPLLLVAVQRGHRKSLFVVDTDQKRFVAVCSDRGNFLATG